MVGRWSDLRDWLEVFSSTKVTTHAFQKIKYCFADLFVCLFFGNAEGIMVNSNFFSLSFHYHFLGGERKEHTAVSMMGIS